MGADVHNPWFMAAGVTSLVTMLIHFTLGGREIARPLLDASGLDPIAKSTNYYFWHLVTLTLVAMASGFVWGAVAEQAADVAFLVLVLAVSFAIWNIALVVWHRRSPLLMPQWILFCAISVLGATGLVQSF